MTAIHTDSTRPARSAASLPRPRWFHLLSLGVLLAAGTVLRFNQIDRQSLWIDEYWALYLATGRGDALFEISRGVIIPSPPRVGFSGAPSWRHIWRGLGSVTHPPLYFLALRGWVDLFGDSDFSTRAMSAAFSLGAIVVLFDLMCRVRGPWPGVIAAGIMAFAPMQLDYSQTTRPYTMLAFIGLVLCHALLSIERLGLSAWRLTVLGMSAAAMALTHYFSAGAILGAAVYAIVRLRGRSRRDALIAASAGLLLAAVLWGPVLWQTRGVFEAFPNFAKTPGNRALSIGQAILAAPAQVFLDARENWNWAQCIPLALLVYLAPLLSRRSPEILLWWLWIVGTIGLLVAVDAARGTTLTGVSRYAFLVSPAVFAILATPLPGRLGMLVPPAALLGAVIFGINRFAIGPLPTQDWKMLAHLLDQSAGPRDIIALTGSYNAEPAYDYFVLAHYMGDWTRPVILLADPPNKAVMRRLAARRTSANSVEPRIWVVGHDPGSDTDRLFPHWRIEEQRSAGIGDRLWSVSPPQ